MVGGSGDCASRSTLRAPVHLPPPQLAFRLALEARCLLGPSRALKQDLSASLPQLLRCARPGRERWRQRARRPRCPFFEIYRVSPRTASEQISENAFRCGRTLKKTTPLGLFFTSQTLFLIPRLPSLLSSASIHSRPDWARALHQRTVLSRPPFVPLAPGPFRGCCSRRVPRSTLQTKYFTSAYTSRVPQLAKTSVPEHDTFLF